MSGKHTKKSRFFRRPEKRTLSFSPQEGRNTQKTELLR